MENNKTKSSAIQKILKCGIISWVAIIALWGIGSLKYDEYFLPSPKTTILFTMVMTLSATAVLLRQTPTIVISFFSN